MEIGETYKVLVEDYDVNGLGVGHIESRVVFIERAAKNEMVVCRIMYAHKKYAFAEAIQVLNPSADRIPPACSYFEQCGGCDLMHISYEAECEIKEKKVKQALRGRTAVEFPPLISSKELSGYRNKVMVPFARDDEDDVIYGFYEKKSHHIIPMRQCLISSELDNRILAVIERYLSLFHISIYNEETHSGVFREVMIRHTSLNEYMVVLVATKKTDLSVLVQGLIREFPEIKSIYLNVNPDKTNVVLSGEYELLYGNTVIIERILGLKFQVSPASFMQVNHKQCERLYAEAIRMAELDKNMNVIDAYCGMGSITLNIAKQVKKVYGIEVVEAAIANANQNKEINEIYNAEFICGKCEEEIVRLINKERIDVIFFDPPRKGCEKRFLDTVADMGIPKIIYISCNIATAARDIEYLEKRGYALREATPVDLFSRTSHVECVVRLDLKESIK